MGEVKTEPCLPIVKVIPIGVRAISKPAQGKFKPTIKPEALGCGRRLYPKPTLDQLDKDFD